MNDSSLFESTKKTIFPWLPELVFIYIKALPIGGKLVAPESDVGEFVFVDFMKFDNLPLLFLLLQVIIQFGKTPKSLLPYLIKVLSVNCILLYLVRLFVSFSTETLR